MDQIMKKVDQLAQKFLQNDWRLAVAESCTGGWLAQVCTALPGSSQWFECGWVTYSESSKSTLLKVPMHLIESEGAVSCAVACAMAEGALRESAATHAIAITGIAGPAGGTDKTPVGTVWIAWASRAQATYVKQYHFQGDRLEVRQQSVLEALNNA